VTLDNNSRDGLDGKLKESKKKKGLFQ